MEMQDKSMGIIKYTHPILYQLADIYNSKDKIWIP